VNKVIQVLHGSRCRIYLVEFTLLRDMGSTVKLGGIVITRHGIHSRAANTMIGLVTRAEVVV
jgi:hypothetical protein